jgi:uncharacterized membrane protein (Fun14 family)
VFGVAVAGGNGPWRARSVHLALLLVVVGLAWWVRDAAKGPPPTTQQVVASADQTTAGGGWDFSRPVPWYARVCASYVGGFFIGWALRHFLRLALGLLALGTLVVGVGKYVGCKAAPAETGIKERATWVQHETDAATGYLKGLLPSTSAGAVGIFLGFRRKDRAVAPSADPQASGPD